jgi:hypothetical protein
VDEGFATRDGLKEIILAAIEADWAELCASPQLVAERAAEAIYPMISGTAVEDDITGAPWATR